MKLCLAENSLRLRLSAAEVAEFARTGQVACTIAFGPTPAAALRYALARLPVEDNAPAVRVRYVAGALVVEVPATLAEAWTSSESIGFEGRVLVAENRELRILVEKDLGCRH